jgi:uncharacterized protein (TIGR00369 family)
MEKTLSDERAAFLAADFSNGFIRFCRINTGKIRRGYFESRVIVEDCHRQQDGFFHAGLMATMADHTAGYSAFTIAPEDHQILTIEFKINFLKPAYGNQLICRSTVIREGRQILVAESSVFDVKDTQEALAAKAMVTLMAVPKEKISKDPAKHSSRPAGPENSLNRPDDPTDLRSF